MTKIKSKLPKWLRRLTNMIMIRIRKKYSVIATTVTSVVSIFLSVLATDLHKWLSSVLTDSKPPRIFCTIVIIVGTIWGIYQLARFAEWCKLKIYPEYMDDTYMKHAFLHIKRLGANRQESFQDMQKSIGDQISDEFVIDEAVRNMQLVVQSCFNFFDSAFSETGQLVDNIKFESTFMTKSYIDQEITIPCSANKENRKPISMLQREEKPTIFNETETAKIYKMERPAMILIEDTSADTGYTEIYAEQKNRIKSSVILPVLSHKNTLLGTLVVHCNQAGFFKKSRYQFWNELLEIFSVELGYHKLLLDYYMEKNHNMNKPF